MPNGHSSIHLHHQPRLTKKRGRVDNYSLAVSVSDEQGRNQKKIILRLGELADGQAQQYRILLKTMNKVSKGVSSPEMLLLDWKSAVLQGSKHYLDVLTLSKLWDRLELNTPFEESGKSVRSRRHISIADVAKILTINRLLDPSSKVGSIEWLQNTWLAHILQIDESSYNKNTIFRALSGIHKQKPKLEKFLFNFSASNYQANSLKIYYFDGSTSWFEGTRCKLAKFDKEKTRGYFDQVLGLMLVTDRDGYPVAWEAVDGNQKDTTAFKDFIERMAEDYGVEEITYCFDRGVASSDNFSLINKCKSKFISAIKDNQIKSIFDLERFQLTRNYLLERAATPTLKNKKRRVVGIDGFYQLGEHSFFKELGTQSDGQRYVASFNVQIYEKEQANRKKGLEAALHAVSMKNMELALAKGDRDFNATERDLLDTLKKYKVGKFFSYKISPLISANKAQSLTIELSFNNEALHLAQLSDGLLFYVTDHIETHDGSSVKDDYLLHARDIVGHYKAKYVIENAFREMKSFLRIRPFHVWTEEHVRAHYDIAILGYFINNVIYRALRSYEVSIREFYKELDSRALAIEIVDDEGKKIIKPQIASSRLQKFTKILAIDSISPATINTSLSITT